MLQDSYRFNIHILMFTNKIRPYKSHAYHRRESCDTLDVTHMGILDVEAGGFHGLEGSLDLPAFLIGQDSTFWTAETYENLQFGNPVGVLDPASGKIDIFTLVKEKLMVKFLLADPEVIEKPPCTYTLTGGRLDNPEVLPDTDVIPDAPAVQPSDPFLSYELSVSDQAVDTVLSEKADETLHDFLTFFPIGVASFGEKTENKRESNPLVCHAQHQYVDVEIPELPVGTVHAQNKIRLDRKQRENHTGDYVEIKNVLGEESLKTSQAGVPVHVCGHRASQFMKADCLHHTQRVEEQRHKLYAGQIHTLSKMFLHNREDLINFERVLGNSSFHGEKSPNFSFKLLIFRDFCKYNQLKFRCLTA